MGDKARGETDREAGSPALDYLLVVGPGRSGSTFLYRLINRHAAFCAPHIKEGHYYRSPRRFGKAHAEVSRDASATLLDVSNLAWRDPALLRGINTLLDQDRRILLVVLLRNHRDRAISMARYHRSRGLPSMLLNSRALEYTLLRNSLTPADLTRIFESGADVLVIGFDALVERTAETLAHLARLCGTAPFSPPDPAPVNPTMQARSLLLSTAGKLAATTLRGVGGLRLLQRLRDDSRVTHLFFRPVDNDSWPVFSHAADAQFADLSARCRAASEQAGERIAADLWLVPGRPGFRL